MSYITDLTPKQKLLIRAAAGDDLPSPRKYCVFDVFNAIAYVLRTGCQWHMLPAGFPKWKAVYHHFRSWSARGWFSKLLKTLVGGKRAARGHSPEPTVAVVDSQTVRWGYRQSAKGIDGHKRVKGIKRHLSVDSLGYPLDARVTTANVHDSKAACSLLANTLSLYPTISLIKADKAYSGPLERALPQGCAAELRCVKSNFGTSDFIPMEGRWVVEAAFAWMEDYRRLARNYERHLSTAREVYIAACVMFMLRYFR